VTVIPEIEMPGHSMAALASYPELGCTGGPYEVQTRWGVFDDVLCAGKEETFKFLEDVLSEVIELFPSKYIHIGGDECPKTRWEKCPLCQKRMKEEGLKDEHELQSYFIQRIEKFVLSKGRRIIGWDEILEGGLAPEATVMSWRGTAGGIAAAKQKHDVIMTPYTYVYLDYYQSEPEGEPLAIGGYLPLEKVYSYNPMPKELTQEEQKYILGVQGNLWAEYLSSPEQMEYMAYPRMFAISEIGWTPEKLKDFEDFLARLEVLEKRYDVIGINYFKGEYRDTRAPSK
jgi:hexosaminidase